MGYIDLDCGSYSARIILGKHTKPTSAKQISNNNSGILLEGFIDNQQLMFNSIIRDVNPNGQYKEIMSSAKNLGTPLVAAEPVWRTESYRYAKKLVPYFALCLILNSISEPLIENIGEISALDPKVIQLKRITNLMNAIIPCLKLVGRSRNLLMSHRTEAFAEILKEVGAVMPQLDLVVGAAHVGIIDCFKMKPEDRASNILNDKFCRELISPSDLSQILCIKYYNVEGKWHSFKIEDTKLSNLRRTF